MVAKIEKMNMPSQYRILALDTATRYTGYAVFETMAVDPLSAQLAVYGIVKADQKDLTGPVRERNDLDNCMNITRKVTRLFKKLLVSRIVQEFPSFHAGEVGMQAARQGDTLQLARLCGMIETSWMHHSADALACHRILLPPCLNVTYTKWNGQVPKEVTCNRLKTFFGIEADYKTIENNYADAIMLGKWFIEEVLKLQAYRKPAEESERCDL